MWFYTHTYNSIHGVRPFAYFCIRLSVCYVVVVINKTKQLHL